MFKHYKEVNTKGHMTIQNTIIKGKIGGGGEGTIYDTKYGKEPYG